MNHYLIHLMPRENPDYCFIDKYPKELGLKSYKIAHGERLGPDYPANARVYMTDRYSGIQTPDLVENACGMLIVSKRVKEVLERTIMATVEYLPLTICNHKKRVASSDHFIVNPIGTVDCLNLKASDIVYHEDKVVAVRDFVLDPAKLEHAPPLFRVQEDSYAYIMSEQILEALRTLEPRPTNFLLELLNQVPASPASAPPAT
ncbi:imm11 family protein [Corallococcus macrosporus]|uniref:Immunity MXAN-0049 protein domain-containing protein n=1 Tax=Corallococcus macrosporus DSM 14697 TaxID=1189310 RepID=A0A286NVY9_9BACT|nr:DUF1629 domain-containing protein [Corallococcus macrosporus]ATB51334.1 hypothetical protein MYMAC_006992 [Corallococcus macrosporus DSM 14697]